MTEKEKQVNEIANKITYLRQNTNIRTQTLLHQIYREYGKVHELFSDRDFAILLYPTGTKNAKQNRSNFLRESRKQRYEYETVLMNAGLMDCNSYFEGFRKRSLKRVA